MKLQLTILASLAVAILSIGCGPSRFEKRMAQHRMELSHMVGVGTKEAVADLYGPPHHKAELEDADFWSYRFSLNRKYTAGVYSYHHYYYHSDSRYFHGPYAPFHHPYHSYPVTYSVPYPYELILKFDKEGVLQHWRIRTEDEY